jgi:hypothetical protein
VPISLRFAGPTQVGEGTRITILGPSFPKTSQAFCLLLGNVGGKLSVSHGQFLSFSFSQHSTAAEARQAPKVIRRVRLLLPPNPNEPEVSEGEPGDSPEDGEPEDGEMEVDELEDDDYVPVS